jgi:DedD protein
MRSQSTHRGTTGLDQSKTQRVVGATVLVIAAAVILPVLFDGQGSYELPLESRIPTAEPFPEVPRVIAERPEIAADSGQLGFQPDVEPVVTLPEEVPVEADAPAATVVLGAAEPEPQVSSTATPAPAVEAVVVPPVLDSAGLPEGWSVRLASFSSEANALALVQRLQARGHRAYTRPITSTQGPLIAVFVGPGVDRAAMLQLQRQLQEEFQLSGMVVRYEIEAL